MQILLNAAGNPEYEGGHYGVCRVCGAGGDGIQFSSWVRNTFTDHDKLVAGDILCKSCQFAFDESSMLLARRVGKEKPQRMRNYSHFVVCGEWIPLSKGDKARMTECLRRKPELTAIATSGQKHIIFRAQPGWWQIEEQSTLPLDGELWSILDTVESLYAVFSKNEIETGRYSQRRMMEFGLAEFLHMENQIKLERGTLAFELAIFLATKGDEGGGVSEGIPSGTKAVDSPVAGNRRGVQTEVRTEHMGPIREQHQSGGVHQQAEPFCQLNLFETDD